MGHLQLGYVIWMESYLWGNPTKNTRLPAATIWDWDFFPPKDTTRLRKSKCFCCRRTNTGNYWKANQNPWFHSEIEASHTGCRSFPRCLPPASPQAPLHLLRPPWGNQWDKDKVWRCLKPISAKDVTIITVLTWNQSNLVVPEEKNTEPYRAISRNTSYAFWMISKMLEQKMRGSCPKAYLSTHYRCQMECSTNLECLELNEIWYVKHPYKRTDLSRPVLVPQASRAWQASAVEFDPLGRTPPVVPMHQLSSAASDRGGHRQRGMGMGLRMA